MQRNIPARSMGWLVLAGGLLPLTFALFAQYMLQLPPCHFCLLQRYPYVLVALCGILLLLRPSATRPLLTLAILGWLSTAALGLYHTGIERGWIAYEGGCVADISASGSVEELRDQVMGAPRVSCADAAEFLGLSMASWNSIAAFGFIALSLALYRKRHE